VAAGIRFVGQELDRLGGDGHGVHGEHRASVGRAQRGGPFHSECIQGLGWDRLREVAMERVGIGPAADADAVLTLAVEVCLHLALAHQVGTEFPVSIQRTGCCLPYPLPSAGHGGLWERNKP
jgi:hypothetical protein